MSDRPDSFMPLFIGDYLADTMRLTRDQHGGYLLLIMDYWRNGEAPPDDDEILATITKSTPSEWKKLRPILAKFFTIEDGAWKHGRIEKEMKKAAENYASKVERAKNAAAKRWAKHMPEQCSSNASGMLEECQPQPQPQDIKAFNKPLYRSGKRAAARDATAAPPVAPSKDWADEIPEWAAFKASLAPTEWLAWFAGTRPNGSITTLIVPSDFSAAQIHSRYGPRLQAHFGEAFQLKAKGGPQ